MPMYTYKCSTENCEHHELKLVKMAERDEKTFDCKECKAEGSLKFTAFLPGTKAAGIVFKGKGFHEGY